MDKKRIRQWGVLLLAACIFLDSTINGAASDIDQQLYDVRIEGAAACMPEVNIYCYPRREEQLDKVEVSYGGETLAVEQIVPYGQSGQGIHYYMLLDVSASSSPEYFAKMKEEIVNFQQGMQTQDSLSLISFGDSVQVVFEDRKASDDISAAVTALVNTDQTTCLFEAIDKAAKLADTEQAAKTRKIMVVLTDGEDFSENTSTKEEALATLKEKMIPLYAMAAKEMSYGRENPSLDSMGAFVRESGGVMEVFSVEDAAAKMEGMQHLFQSAYMIQAKAASNVIDYRKKPLTVTFSGGITQTAEYSAAYYEEDGRSPSASVEKYGQSALKISFSEPVLGAGEASAYEISHDGKSVTEGYMVRYNEGDSPSAVITFEEELKNGEYQIDFHNVTDVSMEKNPLASGCSLEVSDGRKPDIRDYLMQYQVFVVGGVGILVMLFAFVIAWRMLGKRKGVVTVEGRAVLQSNLQTKHQIRVQKREIPARQIQLSLEGAKEIRPITVDVVKSIIVGRSRECEVSIEDEKMSRQHFAITDREGEFWIEDLHTTNGTSVNGQRLTDPRRLAPGDRIKVGDIAMTVRW